MRITPAIEKINDLFSSFFSAPERYYAFSQDNTQNISINILGLLNAFTGKTKDGLKDTLNGFNNRYVFMIEHMFLTDEHFDQSVFIVSQFVKDDLFDFPTREDYTYVFDRELVKGLAESILSFSFKESTFSSVGSENNQFRKKMSIFIVLYYLINCEYTKNTIKVFEMFKDDRDFDQKILSDLRSTFPKELDVLFGSEQDHENHLLSIFCEIDDLELLSLLNANTDNHNDVDNIQNSLIFYIIEKARLVEFCDRLVDQYMSRKNDQSRNVMLSIMLKILQKAIIERG